MIILNKIMLTGRLTKDADMSFLPGSGTPKVTFTVAVDRAYQKDKTNKKVDFIPMEMIGKHVEKLAPYLTKGKMIGIEGELNIDTYEKDGAKKSFTKVKVDRLEFLGGGKAEATAPPKFDPVLDDDLPF